MSNRILAISLLLFLTPSACKDPAPRRQSGVAVRGPSTTKTRPPKKRIHRVRTVLIQLDGLSALWLDRWLKERRFLPRQKPATAAEVAAGGLSRLAAGARATSLVPVDPSVTAPNLATMLTGTFPAHHGILSNRFYRGGKRVNGFVQPLGAETLWQAAPRQGLRTVTWAAMGTRCDEPPPTLLRAACYAAGGRVSRARPAVDLTLAPEGGNAQLELQAGRRAPGTPRLLLGVRRGKAGKVALVAPAGAVLRGGGPGLSPGEARDILWSGGKLPDGTAAARRLTTVVLRSFDARSGQARFYVSGTAINLARPAAFRQTLDRAGLIRPVMADEHSFQHGRIDEHLFCRTGLAELDAAVALADRLGKGDTFDLAILYLGAVDSFGHMLLAGKGRQELSKAEVARFRAALERGLRGVDRRLGLILDALDLKRTRVVLASDHGMVPVLQDVSLRAALVPLDRRIRVITAAGAGYVHLPEGVSPDAVEQRLAALRVDGKSVFAKGQGRVVRAHAFHKIGLPATAADLFVQAAPGFALSYRRTKTLTAWPKNQATHGFRSDLPAMHGVFLAAGPGLRKSPGHPLGRLHMTQVAAAVSDAANMKPPKHARPGPKGLWSDRSP